MFARDLALTVRELQAVPTEGAPPPRHRARPLADHDQATLRAIESAAHLIDAGAALAVWEDALEADPHGGPEVSRPVFLDELDVDEATLRRSKGAAIHQACAALPSYLDTYPLIVERAWHELAALGVARLDAGA